MLLRLTLALALFGCPAKPSPQRPTPTVANGTLSGSVSFVGTPCPEPKGPPCDGAYPNYDVVVYTQDGTTEVGRTKTDADGKFSLALPAGKYVIFTQTGPMKTDRGRNAVLVSRDDVATLDLRVDTGVR